MIGRKRRQVLIKIAEGIMGGCQNPEARDYAWALGFGEEYDAGKYVDKIDKIWYKVEADFYNIMQEEDIGFLCDTCGWWCPMDEESQSQRKTCEDCEEDYK